MIQRISTINEFLALKAEWERLYAASGLSNLFLTHEWLSNWLVHFGKNEWMVLLEREGQNSNILSLVLFKVSNGHLTFIGNQHSNFPGFLTSNGKTSPVRTIMEYLCNKECCKSLALIDSPDEPRFEKELRDVSEDRWIIIKKNCKIMRSINLSGDFEAYLGGREKKVRHELKRKARKLQESGEIMLRCFQDCSDADVLFGTIGDIEKDSWKFKSGTAIISSENEVSFYKNLYLNYAKSSNARAYVLDLNRVPLAYIIGVLFDGTFYALKTSYKESYKTLSPGTTLFVKVIETIMGQNSAVKKIELLGEDARWKEELSTDRKGLCTYHLFSKCFQNICYLAIRKSAKEIRDLLK